MPVSLHLLVCEIFVVTLCQHLSVFMSTQIVYYPTQLGTWILSFYHYITKHFRSVHPSLTSSVVNLYYVRNQTFSKLIKNVILVLKVVY